MPSLCVKRVGRGGREQEFHHFQQSIATGAFGSPQFPDCTIRCDWQQGSLPFCFAGTWKRGNLGRLRQLGSPAFCLAGTQKLGKLGKLGQAALSSYLSCPSPTWWCNWQMGSPPICFAGTWKVGRVSKLGPQALPSSSRGKLGKLKQLALPSCPCCPSCTSQFKPLTNLCQTCALPWIVDTSGSWTLPCSTM